MYLTFDGLELKDPNLDPSEWNFLWTPLTFSTPILPIPSPLRVPEMHKSDAAQDGILAQDNVAIIFTMNRPHP